MIKNYYVEVHGTNQTSKRHKSTRAMLKRKLTDWSGTHSPPRFKTGLFAYLTDQGDVWISRSTNLTLLVPQFNSGNKQMLPKAVREAFERNERITLFVGRDIPDEELESFKNSFGDRLLQRGTINRQGPGQLFRITHINSGFYYLMSSRQEADHEYKGLSRFLYNLQNSATSGRERNRKISDFITDHANDILKEQGFTATLVGLYDSAEHEQKMFNDTVALHGVQRCLNLHNV